MRGARTYGPGLLTLCLLFGVVSAAVGVQRQGYACGPSQFNCWPQCNPPLPYGQCTGICEMRNCIIPMIGPVQCIRCVYWWPNGECVEMYPEDCCDDLGTLTCWRGYVGSMQGGPGGGPMCKCEFYVVLQDLQCWQCQE